MNLNSLKRKTKNYVKPISSYFEMKEKKKKTNVNITLIIVNNLIKKEYVNFFLH